MSVNPNQTNANATTSFFAPASGGKGGDFPSGATIGVENSGGSVWGVSTMTANLNTTENNPNWYPVRYSLNPAQASQGGQVAMVLTYNPDDAGQVAVSVGAKSDGSAFIGAVWEGYITMPLDVWGAAINMYSDNETFMYMDGKAGAIGSISTGVEFVGAFNTLSSIRDPTKAYNADMTALLSTLKDVYPACFS